jgi:hypothetical protein
MFSPKAFITDSLSVPANWIFQNYLGIEELVGQTVKIRSVFKQEERTPSMYIYLKDEYYRFKCFATGIGGSPIDLMQKVWGLSFSQTSEIIRKDYAEFLQSGKKPSTTEAAKVVTWSVGNFQVRKWNKEDALFWTSFNIGSDMLAEHFVQPLEYYYMLKSKEAGTLVEQFKNTGKQIYGFFNAKGELYKIYRPYDKNAKYIKVREHLQGSDQLKGHENLILISSLKDMMSMKSIKIFKSDYIAPDSENVYFDPEQIKSWKKKYKSIITLMDSDQAGIKAMKYYEETYNIPLVYVSLEKDPSDLIKHHGVQRAVVEYGPPILRATEKYKLMNEKNTKKLYIL